MKKKELLSVLVLVPVVLLGTTAFAQKNEAAGSGLNVYASPTYGFRVQYQGTLAESNKSEFVITLPSSNAQSGTVGKVRIFVAQKPFVYLPGTYGGKYYFSGDSTGITATDRVRGDSVDVNGLQFARDYWTVYAGMGQWETVINCYAFHDGQYYVVSLNHDFATPKPGEVINGSRVTKQQISGRLVSSLQDSTNSYVRSFNHILESFSLTK